jgi:hypothetical protein
MQDALIGGFAEIGALMTPINASDIAQWQARRRAYLRDSQSRITIGHVDIFAWPTGRR